MFEYIGAPGEDHSLSEQQHEAEKQLLGSGLFNFLYGIYKSFEVLGDRNPRDYEVSCLI